MTKIRSDNAQIYLKNIIQNSPGSLYWKDINGIYLGCNQMQAEMAGFKSPEEMIGKTDYDMSWKNIADTLRATDKRIIETGKPEELIETATLVDGTKVSVLTSKAPLYDEEGQIIGIIGTSLDITARVEAEEREKQALVSAATAEAQRKAEEEIRRAIMVLAGSMAHDLRTPLFSLNLINHQLKKNVSEVCRPDLSEQNKEEI